MRKSCENLLCNGRVKPNSAKKKSFYALMGKRELAWEKKLSQAEKFFQVILI